MSYYKTLVQAVGAIAAQTAPTATFTEIRKDLRNLTCELGQTQIQMFVPKVTGTGNNKQATFFLFFGVQVEYGQDNTEDLNTVDSMAILWERFYILSQTNPFLEIVVAEEEPNYEVLVQGMTGYLVYVTAKLNYSPPC